ncbi:cobalamin biosynthesis protein CobD [Treponema primitia ZAS-2]|uniref:Cobalamin biosynthesis protein CobD n=1 Tax=Treponema primitia (strain ATCC BAA-887 / DSM 12427 / ZAS-2) TaxID=545694 RepID=F5YLB5_TREPZ|nr:adenosylcobinamide-phosphate synthase CbiB [Treponema primitia]AEF83524.1 cobalamin biosynthesis protein CobD [Treponema primitia ZAS-2]
MILLWSTAALATGFILDLIFGDPPAIPHIIRFVGKIVSRLEKLFLKVGKSPGVQFCSGLCFTCVVILISTGIPFALLYFAYGIHPVAGFLVESFLCYQLIAVKDMRVESMRVYDRLKADDLDGARWAVSRIVGRDTDRLDRAGITRAAVETVAENTGDGVASPLFYLMLGGAALGCFFKSVNTMDSMVGYKNEKYLYFGRAAAKLDDILNFLPSRLCALVMIFATALFRFDAKNALRIWRRDSRNHASPNSAQTEAVCAGALGVRLAGPAYYEGALEEKLYIGDDTRPIEDDDIIRANRLLYGTAILLFILAMGVRICCMAVIFTVMNN